MDWMVELRWADAADVVLVALVLWAALYALRRSRARAAFLGLLVLAPVYLVSSWLEFQLTLWILQGFVAASVIVLVVVFQDELRGMFEQVGTLGFWRSAAPPPPDAFDALVGAVRHLAQGRTGALIVIPGTNPLDRHLGGGIPLHALLSEPLLLSLFDASSPGHDGAIVLAGNRVERFAVHLPLSTNREELGPGGTRHAAALGLAERSDALCIVVSEERGTIAIAREGHLEVLPGAEVLAVRLREFVTETAPVRDGRRNRASLIARAWREGLAAAGLALVLWIVLVPGSRIVDVVRDVKVRVENLPPGFELESADPPEVRITLSGPRRSVLLSTNERLEARIDAWYVRLGRRTFQLTSDDVQGANGVTVRAIEPDRVRLSVRSIESAAPAQP